MTTPSAPEIYCVECKARTGSRDAQIVTMKNGRRATRVSRAICAAEGISGSCSVPWSMVPAELGLSAGAWA